MVFGPPSSRKIRRDEALIVRLVELEQQHQSTWVYHRLEQILPSAAARRALAIVASIAHLLDQAGYEVSVLEQESRGSRPHTAPPANDSKITVH